MDWTFVHQIEAAADIIIARMQIRGNVQNFDPVIDHPVEIRVEAGFARGGQIIDPICADL